MPEAVIQFRYALAAPAPDAAVAADTMNPVFRRAQALGVMGRDPRRYDGLAFGNLSMRAGAGFWITATQTADLVRLDAHAVTLIDHWDPATNTVTARGVRPPSSEALSHAAIHDARAGRPTWVLHGHAPDLWRHAAALGLPVTDPGAPNGTLALARELAALAGTAPGVIVMGGHRDGVIAYADDGPGTLEAFEFELRRAAALHAGSDHVRPLR